MREVDGGGDGGGMHANTEGAVLGVSLITYYVCMHVKHLCYYMYVRVHVGGAWCPMFNFNYELISAKRMTG